MDQGMTFTEAIDAGQADDVAKKQGGFVVAKLRTGHVVFPTSQPKGNLTDIADPELLEGSNNAEIVARYQLAGGTWERITGQEQLLEKTAGGDERYYAKERAKAAVGNTS